MSALADKVAIVTGSGRGIGAAIASRLARAGARVVVNDLDEEPARERVADLERDGHEAFAVVGDVAAEDFGERLISETLAHFGTLDITIGTCISLVSPESCDFHGFGNRRDCSVGRLAGQHDLVAQGRTPCGPGCSPNERTLF